MEDNNTYSMCIIGAMDHLWFNQIILLTHQPISPHLKKPQPTIITELSLTCPSTTQSLSALSDQPISDIFSFDDELIKNDEEKEEHDEVKKTVRPTRLSFGSNRKRSSSSSPKTRKPAKNRTRNRQRKNIRPELQKSMSCRSLGDLELEEVKGFIDLGFRFKKEDLSPKMMSLIPGLQRLQLSKSRFSEANMDDEVIINNGEEEEVHRPYLSEAWLIKKPDSPLLNMKVPKVCGADADDMKKHLKSWARTVASVIHQEC